MAWRSHLHGLLRHPSEPRILLLRSDRRWRLPRAVARGRVWSADAATVVAAFERRLGMRPWLLRQVAVTNDEVARKRESFFELEVGNGGWSRPAHGRWIGRGDLARVPLADETHRDLLATYLDRLSETPETRPPWARPGWHVAVREWVEEEVARLGQAVIALEQVKHWSISSVLRVKTDGRDLYFKVPLRLPLFVDEAVVTKRLARRFPAYVPRPLAVEPDRGWMLLPAFDELFDWDAPLSLRQESLRRFAELQRRAAALVTDLLADGCLDRRLEVLEDQIDPLLADAEAVAYLAADEVAELRRLAPTLKELCRRLNGLGLPPTLVHGDLHLLNVARVDGTIVYFDWTDACIAHPFIDLHSLQWEKDETTRTALLDAYLEPWTGVLPDDDMREAVKLAAVVTPLHHAVSYQHIVAGLEPSAKGELHVADAFLREALARVRSLLDSP